MKISLQEKGGFKCVGLVKVYKSGALFYSRKFKDVGFFNLPKGNYIIKGNVKPMAEPIGYAYELPKPERVNKFKGKLKIEFLDNPHKASTIPSKGLVFIDHKIKKLDECAQAFILAHEVGHRHYTTESKCDAYAMACLLDLGYNPSQIAIASKVALSMRNCDRISKVFTFGANIRQV